MFINELNCKKSVKLKKKKSLAVHKHCTQHTINTIFTDQVPNIHLHKNTYYAAIKIFKSAM